MTNLTDAAQRVASDIETAPDEPMYARPKKFTPAQMQELGRLMLDIRDDNVRALVTGFAAGLDFAARTLPGPSEPESRDG